MPLTQPRKSPDKQLNTTLFKMIVVTKFCTTDKNYIYLIRYN